MFNAPGNFDWSYSQSPAIRPYYNQGQVAPFRARTLSIDHTINPDESADDAYKSWQSSPHRYELDPGDQACYASILEELSQMDSSMLVDRVAPFANPQEAQLCTLRTTKRTRPQPVGRDSYTSPSLSPLKEETLLPSPISNDGSGLVAPKTALAKKRPAIKKSPSRAKIPHSAVEKRYRSNLDSKMFGLQQCVPALHVKTDMEDESVSPDATLESAKQDTKMPKGVILEGAADYIRTLEARTAKLDKHVELLERRLTVLQRIALEKTRGGETGVETAKPKDRKTPTAKSSPALSTTLASATDRASKSPIAHTIRGTSAADWKYAVGKVEREPSGNLHVDNISPPAKRRRVNRNKLVKVAVGSLLGVALWEGYTEAELPAGSQNSRGLFAIPIDFLTLGAHHLLVAVLGPDEKLLQYILGSGWSLLKMILFFGVVIYLFGPTVLVLLHWTNSNNEKALSMALASASPLPVTVAFCRDAWATAVQSIQVPDHGMLLEAAALLLKTWKLLLRSIFGWRGYSYLTGATIESEILRVKAWDIALDAQLAGGDLSVSTRRLLLTFLASMTIEDTPLRLLRKSLHVRMIFRNVSNTQLGRQSGITSVAEGLAAYFWLKARTLQKGMQATTPDPVNTAEMLAVPGHRWALMNQAPEAVFADSIIIRIAHVACNEPLDCPIIEADEGMDAVFDDVAIRSPLDALAALFSSLTLRNALLATLDTNSKSCSDNAIKDVLDLALATAPPGSRASMRARAAHAVFTNGDKIASIIAALKETPKHHEINTTTFRFTEPSTASICTTNVRIALRSAALIMGASSKDISPLALNESTVSTMLGIIERTLQSSDVTILGFATAFRCAKVCSSNLELRKDAGQALQLLTRRLQLIIASEWSIKYGVDKGLILLNNEL